MSVKYVWGIFIDLQRHGLRALPGLNASVKPMKLGCGCTLALLPVVGLAAGCLWVGAQMLRTPEISPVSTTAAEGKAAQDKLFALIAGGSRGQKSTAGSVVLSERELNAFLSRHLGQVGELPLSDIGIRLPESGRVEIVARVPLRNLLSEPPVAGVRGSIPTRWLDRRVWLHFDGDARVEAGGSAGRRYLRLDLRRFSVGRQPLPTVLTRLMLDPATSALLRWRLPDSVIDITIEPGRAVVRTAS